MKQENGAEMRLRVDRAEKGGWERASSGKEAEGELSKMGGKERQKSRVRDRDQER